MKKIVSFDFDGTMCFTPEPIEGEKVWQEKTGTVWPYTGWWSKKAYDMVWRKGLMIKLKRFGINGRMFDWIAAFLEGRSIQVRVGTSLSHVTELENGTPQGAMISPSTFIAMINDLPENASGVDTSLFADDTMLQEHGQNVKLLEAKMQQALDSVQRWCDQWGFTISTNKTVAVLFTRSACKEREVKLSINGKPLKIEESAKFLGVVSTDA
jgi:hypothetical protein